MDGWLGFNLVETQHYTTVTTN